MRRILRGARRGTVTEAPAVGVGWRAARRGAGEVHSQRHLSRRRVGRRRGRQWLADGADRDAHARRGGLGRRGTVGDRQRRRVVAGRAVGVTRALSRAGRGTIAEVPAVAVGRLAALGGTGEGDAEGRVAGRRRARGGGREWSAALDPEVLERVAERRLIGGGHGERRQPDVVVGVDRTRMVVLHHALHRGNDVAGVVGDVREVGLLHVSRRCDHDGRHAERVADVVRTVVAVLGVVLGDDDDRVVLVGRVAHDRSDDGVRRGVVLGDVLEGPGVVVEQLDVGVGRQPVCRNEALEAGRDRLVVVVLAVAGVVVVGELLGDARAGTVDRQHLEVVGGRIAPVPAATAQHPIEVAVHDECVRAAAGSRAGLRRAGVGAFSGEAGRTAQEAVELGPGGGRIRLLLRARGRLRGEEPPVVGTARRLRARAVGVHQRVRLGERVQVGHRADVVGALHLAVAAGLDRGRAVTQVVVEGVVLAVEDHEVREGREVGAQRVGNRLRLRDRLARLDGPRVRDVVVVRLRKLGELGSGSRELGAGAVVVIGPVGLRTLALRQVLRTGRIAVRVPVLKGAGADARGRVSSTRDAVGRRCND